MEIWLFCVFFLALNHSSFQILCFVCVVEFNEHVVILLFRHSKSYCKIT